MKQEQEMDINELKENDIINFSFGPRYYYGRIIIFNDQKIVELLNSEDRFKLQQCSNIKKLQGGIKMAEKEEKVKKEKKSKTPSITDVRVENAKKIIAFMTNELHIEKKDMTKTLSRCYRLLGK